MGFRYLVVSNLISGICTTILQAKGSSVCSLFQTTPLHCAAMSGKVVIVKFLIDQYAADVKSRDKEKVSFMI